MMSVSPCESLPGAPAGSCSIQCAVVDTPGPQPASCNDVWVHIVDETSGMVLGRYHAVAETLKQHSTFFAACLSANWAHTTSSSSSSQAQQPIVLMHVADPHHTLMAVALLNRMHNRSPETPAARTATYLKTTAVAANAAVLAARSASAGASMQHEACVLLALADYYHVPQAVAKGLPHLLKYFLQGQPSWQTVLFLLHSTHEGIGMHPDFAKPYSLAVQYTLHQLRDLEAVLQHRELSQVLLALPGHVLLMLLQGPDTCVTWESTVVQAISAWLELQASVNLPLALLRELAGCVRLRGLPRSYLNTVLAQLGWYNYITEPGTIQQADAFLHIADSIRQELDTAVGGQQHTTASGTTLNTSSSSSNSLSPAVIQESKALAAVLEPKLRADPQWMRWLLAPRLPSSVRGLKLTINLSVSRLTHAYNSIDETRTSASSSSNGTNGSSQDSGWHSQWQLGQGSGGTFGGYQWWLHFRFVAASSGHHLRTSTGGNATGQQQTERVTSRKRKQQEAFQLQEATAAAAAAAAAAGSGMQGLLGGEGNAAVQQVMLESVLQQPGTDHMQHPAAPGNEAGAQSPVTPPGSSSGSGSHEGGSSGGSGSGRDSSSSSSRRITWSLQFGVSFDIPYLPKERQFVTPFLMLPPPTLQHPQAHNPNGSTVTRGQKAREGTGVDPGSLPRYLQAGQVLPCVEVLPLRLRSSRWDKACGQKLQQYLDSDKRLRASVTISHMQ